MYTIIHTLRNIDVQIAELKASYDKSLAEKEELSQNIQTTADRLKRASKLTTALADEQIRWAESVEVWSLLLQAGHHDELS